jgi:hypothetical protein
LSTIQKEDDSFAELSSVSGYALLDGFVPLPPVFEKYGHLSTRSTQSRNAGVVDFLLK